MSEKQEYIAPREPGKPAVIRVVRRSKLSIGDSDVYFNGADISTHVSDLEAHIAGGDDVATVKITVLANLVIEYTEDAG